MIKSEIIKVSIYDKYFLYLNKTHERTSCIHNYNNL
jgi:hypothetical protein